MYLLQPGPGVQGWTTTQLWLLILVVEITVVVGVASVAYILADSGLELHLYFQI